MQDEVADVPAEGDEIQAASQDADAVISPEDPDDQASSGEASDDVEDEEEVIEEDADGKRYPVRTRTLVQHYTPGHHDGPKLTSPTRLRVSCIDSTSCQAPPAQGSCILADQCCCWLALTCPARTC